MIKRLTSLDDVALGIHRPLCRPSRLGTGIVHLGVGAFHRAHQAVYTDAALAAEGGNWRIVGVSPQSTAVADALNQQNGLYTLIERGEAGTAARVIGSIDRVIAATCDRAGVMDAMINPTTRIVSLTVTEKAYGIDRVSGGIDPAHPAIKADLKAPRSPISVIGLITETLRARGARGMPAFTILCCDNLPNNGRLLRAAVIDFASRIDSDLARWIETDVAFPSTMVDRITPAPTDQTRADAATLIGCRDEAAVETEAFSQWVVEDRFPTGRPTWEAGGALFVQDVAPYERMKLRMLNGAHSMLAYAGFISDHALVRNVMTDKPLALLIERHMKTAALTLEPLPGIDVEDYAHSLLARFRNPAIAHETYQIAMDGTEKLPQRILEPAVHALEHGQDVRPFAFAVAAWMRYSLGRKDDGETYALRDPMGVEIEALLEGTSSDDVAAALHELPGLFPEALLQDRNWRETVSSIVDSMLKYGMAEAIMRETDAS
ncbi:MAG: mannitol dehydrogenase family protein [Geminicoccales bacterium]